MIQEQSFPKEELTNKGGKGCQVDHQAVLGRRSCESLAAEDSGTATVGLSEEADLDETKVNKESGLFKISFFFHSTSEFNNQPVLYH